MNIVILILASAGFVVSLYAYLIKKQLVLNPFYKPACDISDKISCSRAFNSRYSSLFGVTNASVGMIFYGLVLLLELFGAISFVYYATIAAAGSTLFLAYLLYMKVGSFCLVCTMIYIINFALLIATMKG